MLRRAAAAPCAQRLHKAGQVHSSSQQAQKRMKITLFPSKVSGFQGQCERGA